MLLVQCSTICFHFLFFALFLWLQLTFVCLFVFIGLWARWSFTPNIITFWIVCQDAWDRASNQSERDHQCVCAYALASHVALFVFRSILGIFSKKLIYLFSNVIKMFFDRFSFILRLPNMFIPNSCKWAQVIVQTYVYNTFNAFLRVSCQRFKLCSIYSALTIPLDVNKSIFRLMILLNLDIEANISKYYQLSRVEGPDISCHHHMDCCNSFPNVISLLW